LAKGYIEETGKSFSFYEYPRRNPIIKPKGEVREFVDDETGEIYKYCYE